MIYFDHRLSNHRLTFLVAGLSPSHGPWILSLFPYNDSLSLHGFTLVPCCCCILIQRFGFSLMTRSVFVHAFLFSKLNLDISVCGSPRCHCVGFSTLMSGFTLKPHCALLHCFLFCFHSLFGWVLAAFIFVTLPAGRLQPSSQGLCILIIQYRPILLYFQGMQLGQHSQYEGKILHAFINTLKLFGGWFVSSAVLLSNGSTDDVRKQTHYFSYFPLCCCHSPFLCLYTSQQMLTNLRN